MYIHASFIVGVQWPKLWAGYCSELHCRNSWFKVAENSFQYFSRLSEHLMGHYNHSILDVKIMVSTNCPIIGEQVAVNFVWHNRLP